MTELLVPQPKQKYRCAASIIWDFDSDLPEEEALQIARKHLGDIPVLDGVQDLRLILRLDKLKQKVEKIRIAEFGLDEVMPFVPGEKKEYVVNGTAYPVRMNSLRYLLFKDNMNCVSCGLQATRVFLECHPSDKSPHFNFYGASGDKLVLMTKDHIHAKSFGGEDSLENFQTMCLICNNLKGHTNLDLDGVRQLRKIYDENHGVVPKKQLHIMVEEARAALAKPWPGQRLGPTKQKALAASRKAGTETVSVSCDLNVYRQNDEVYATPRETPDVLVTTIPKGTLLEPLASLKGRVLCQFGDGSVWVGEGVLNES